jgi:hypothetical protein
MAVALPGDCAFGGVPFDIESTDDGGFYQHPQTDAQGVRTVSYTILLESRADWLDLLALQSRVTVKVALGGTSGRVYVHAGPGSRTLQIPTGAGGSNQNWDAVLTQCTGLRHGWETGLYRADALWVLL